MLPPQLQKELPVVAGRSPGDVKKYGTRGAILLGKQYVSSQDKLELGPSVYMDVSGAHVVFICGKRGGGKSYTMGVVAEGFTMMEDAIRNKLSLILLDTMGVYWPMSHANHEEKKLLEPYGLKPKGIDIKIYTPYKYYEIYKKQGIPTDVPFSLDTAELTAEDWCKAFKQEKYSGNGVYIAKVLAQIRIAKKKYMIKDILDYVKEDKEEDRVVRNSVSNMFKMADAWGLFSDHGTPLHELAKGGQVTVLDVSCYATMQGGMDVKALVVGIVSMHLFVQRMEYRKGEEFKAMKFMEDFFGNAEQKKEDDMPLVWLVIDEAHEFLPKQGENSATEPLVLIMREGRQPGISLILATQQPGKIHTDVMTQSDVVLSHRITARLDVDALGMLAQSWMGEGMGRVLDRLPPLKGTAVLFDDANEKLMQIRVRPRFTWHGGSSPSAMRNEE
jgi:uncharacterized protein